jgi:Mrp family chromosome partitioning ATPase
MEPIDFLGALRRSWRLILTLAVIGGLVGFLFPVSTHKAKVVKNPIPWSAVAVVGAAPTAQGTVVGGGATGDQINFYAARTQVREAALRAVRLTHIKEGHVNDYLHSKILVPAGTGKKQAANASTVRLEGEARTREGAIKLTNAYARVLGTALNKIAVAKVAAKGGTGGGSGYLILQPADKATRARVAKVGGGPTKSKKVRALIGLGIGVVLAAILILLREVLNRRLRNASRAEGHFGYPVVVEIPAELRSIGRPAVKVDVVSAPGSPAAEAYRMLRMSVLFEALASNVVQTEDFSNLVGVPGPADDADRADSTATTSVETLPVPMRGSRQVVLVVSPSHESTRPQVAANLAAAYAEAGQRVVVIGTGELGTGPITGAGRNLTGGISPEDVEVRLEPSWVDRVFRLNLRHFIENSGQLSSRIPTVLDATRPLADVIIVEAPPLLAVHHVEALSQVVDVVLLVGECGTTTFDEARRSGDLLRRMAAPVLGVVLTNVRLKPRDVRQRPERSQLALSSPTALGREQHGSPDVGAASTVPTKV